MTPENKAKELYDKFMRVADPLYKYPMCHDTAKEAALIVCREFLDEMNCTHIGYGKDVMTAYRIKKTRFWQQVASTISKMEIIQS